MTDDKLAVAVGENEAMVIRNSLTVVEVTTQAAMIQKLMKSVMKDGTHYGTIKGCGDKPTLLQPGAQKIAMLFNLGPKFHITKTNLGNEHREYDVTTTLVNNSTGIEVGQGVGSCSTMETKYRYRNASRKCPSCGKDTIIQGKKEWGGGWLCWKKKGGCGDKWEDGTKVIEDQVGGKVENENLADQWNTVLKMAKKRSLVDATLNVGAASDLFTQDLEDLVANGVIVTDINSIPVNATNVTPEPVEAVNLETVTTGERDPDSIQQEPMQVPVTDPGDTPTTAGPPPKVRKTRSDAGKKRGTKKPEYAPQQQETLQEPTVSKPDPSGVIEKIKLDEKGELHVPTDVITAISGAKSMDALRLIYSKAKKESGLDNEQLKPLTGMIEDKIRNEGLR